MTMPISPTIPLTTAEPSPSAGGGSAYARAQALKETLDADPSEPAGESSATPLDGEASSPADSGVAAPPPAPADAARAAERAERLTRIENVRKREAAAEADQRARQQSRAKDSEAETLRKRIAELEPLAASLKNEDELLALAEREGVSAEKLVAAIRKRMTDPSHAAKREAQTEAEKLRAEMKAIDEKHAKEIADLKAERAASEVERVQMEKTATFFTLATEKRASHPRIANAIATWGRHGLVEFVNQQIAHHLTEGYTAEYLHDVVEDYFDKTHAFGGPAPTPEAPPAAGASHSPKKNGAGQPATTLSNALTSGRESLVEDIAPHKLSREERTRRVRDQLDRE